MGSLPMAADRLTKSPGKAVRSQVFALAKGKCELLAHAEKAWGSITFAGTRHELSLKFEGCEAIEAGEAMIEALPQHEFSIPGQLVADAAVRETDHRFGPVETLTATIALLLLEEV